MKNTVLNSITENWEGTNTIYYSTGEILASNANEVIQTQRVLAKSIMQCVILIAVRLSFVLRQMYKIL